MIQDDMAPTWHVKWIMFDGRLESRLGLSQREMDFPRKQDVDSTMNLENRSIQYVQALFVHTDQKP